jgi:hypothetical protein
MTVMPARARINRTRDGESLPPARLRPVTPSGGSERGEQREEGWNRQARVFLLDTRGSDTGATRDWSLLTLHVCEFFFYAFLIKHFDEFY